METVAVLKQQKLLLRRDIKSLRDLSSDCLLMLRNLKRQTCQVMVSVCNVDASVLALCKGLTWAELGAGDQGQVWRRK